jgi:hypothetical protein
MAVKAEGNVTVTYNSNAITAYCNSADLAATIAALDATDFASTGKEYVNDTPEWSISLSGHWDSTLDGYLAPDAITPGTKRTGVIAFTDSGSTTVTYTWTSNAEIADYTVSASTGALITWSGTLRLSGAPVRS